MSSSSGHRGFTAVELTMIVAIVVLLALMAAPHFTSARGPSAAEETEWNCRTVQRAVEEYAASNRGVYPHATNDGLATTGETMIDMLPESSRLTNPYTGARSVPIDGRPTAPGQIGYRPVLRDGVPVGYRIEAHGPDGIVLTVTEGI